MGAHVGAPHEGVPAPVGESAIERRALTLWPRLERGALRRCRHEARCIARLVSRRTNLPPERILALLTMTAVSDDEAVTWFG